jgi:hypothetical protein
MSATAHGEYRDLLLEIAPFTMRALWLLRTVQQRFEAFFAVRTDVFKNRHSGLRPYKCVLISEFAGVVIISDAQPV